MTAIRALVVDDSRVVRHLVTRALTVPGEVEVVATANDGVEALRAVMDHDPDIVVLDVEMPNLDGLEVVKALHLSHPRLPVIMFSTLTERGAKVTVDALLSGASDYVLKPSGLESVDSALATVRDQLLPRVRALCPSVARTREPSTVPARAVQVSVAPPAAPRLRAGRPEVVVVGSSTGGPEVLEELLRSLPGDLAAPVLVAQHMPALFTTMFAKRLDSVCALTVSEAVDGALLAPGQVHIAPGDHHLEVVRSPRGLSLHVHRGPRIDNNRPSATVLLRSAAKACGARSLAVVLTGMGQDGLLGCQAVHDAGGLVLVQDQESSVVWGMPGAVAQAGIADAVLDPGALRGRLLRELT